MLGSFGFCCVSMMPFFIVELMFRSFALRDSTFLLKSAWKAIWTETYNRRVGWSSYQAKPYHPVETSTRLQLTFACVTQAFDSVMGCFDIGELTGNKLLR